MTGATAALLSRSTARHWPESVPNATTSVLIQQLARIVHVLELENQQLKEANAALEQQIADRDGVTDLASRQVARTDFRQT
ncbi:hypothetical protein [Streptomyces scabiei]|uniref:hypothetical protein n=1 Tax=Streptomyces scabiei TaxID=1930 RepID=UPI001B343F59|nr:MULTISPECIES: hypothetical protein [Streptomyces]MBP5888823.1 hypothetical protein [Streptomyces sp. LBUM 1481]MBP5918837.1 hypothetical protein [Streptomyces sp. LBUM 1483]MDX2685108.1 hypothetical protein [Streptomyces scabiei]MDX2753371.1 hypothetical protein [Streptomyces scabiei]MDX2807552.1 hypothetical protein [Streptomyces scabiei]